jgi:hypothetical protein
VGAYSSLVRTVALVLGLALFAFGCDQAVVLPSRSTVPATVNPPPAHTSEPSTGAGTPSIPAASSSPASGSTSAPTPTDSPVTKPSPFSDAQLAQEWALVDDRDFGSVLGNVAMNAVTYGDSKLVSVGRQPAGAAVWTSVDGRRWDIAPWDPVFKSAVMSGVIAGGPGFEAFGIRFDTRDVLLSKRRTAVIWWSLDGIHWNLAPRRPLPNEPLDRTTRGFGQLVDGIYHVLSSDGGTWSASPDATRIPPVDDEQLPLMDRSDELSAGVDQDGWGLRLGFGPGPDDRGTLFALVRSGNEWRRIDGVPHLPVPSGSFDFQGVSAVAMLRGRLIAVGSVVDFTRNRAFGRERARVWLLDPGGSVGTGAFSVNVPRCRPPSSATLGQIVAMTSDRAVDCFGSASLTFRGWVPEPPSEGALCPRDEVTNAFRCVGAFLEPIEGLPGDDGGYGLVLYALGTAITYHDFPQGRWVEVTGHFDDPASRACVYRPESFRPHVPPAEGVAGCGQHFVVSAVRRVSGPGGPR